MSSTADIIKHYEYDPSKIERISYRKFKYPIAIVEPNPEWPEIFNSIQARIKSALGDTVLSVSHVGSTSVPGLPAKDIIDIDLIVKDITAEDDYVPALEKAGFHFLNRDPTWHQHRFFCLYEPLCNLHVFEKDSAEPIRHQIFKDWLLGHADERILYAKAKREAAAASVIAGETGMEYNLRKENVIRQILERALRARGLLS